MSTVRFSCKVEATDPAVPLDFEILLDNQSVFTLSPVDRSGTAEIDIPDDDGNHKLSLCMSGKTRRHTKLDADGNITHDACIKITNIAFDDISISDLIPQVAIYHHDFNGAGPATQDKFYEVMGCNGSVDIEFSTPIYLWLLENM
jgi:hypothetical protein